MGSGANGHLPRPTPRRSAQMSIQNPFTRPTLIAAANLLADFTHSEFDNFMLQFGLESRVSTAVSKQAKANELSSVVLGDEEIPVQTSEGTMSLAEAIVRAAMTVAPGARQGSQWVAFAAGLKRDGFILVEDEDQSLPIRLTPMTATCRVPPLSRVKLGIGWARGVARDAEQ